MFKKSFLRLSIAVSILALFSAAWQPASSHAAQINSPVSKTGCTPEALMILDVEDAAGMQRAIQQLEALGGCALHIYPPRAVIGSAPLGASHAALVQAGVKAVYTSSVDVQALAAEGQAAQSAAAAWNYSLANPQTSEPPPPGAEPLRFDHRIVQPAVSRPDPFAPAPLAAGYYDTALFMARKVAVSIITPESSGAGETWSTARQNSVLSEIQTAMTWWSGQNPLGGMSFSYTEQRSAPTSYEPITLPSTSDNLWIDETLSSLGYSGSYWYDKAYSYANAIRTTHSSDWAVVIYVVDSLNDADGKFSDGYFGYAYSMSNGSGLLVVMTYDNDGWGIANMDKVTAHEFGHIFGAADEYCQPPYACCWGNQSYGYLNILNSLCEAKCDYYNASGTPTPDTICDGDNQTPASGCQGCSTCVSPVGMMYNNSWALDTPSKEQVGIRNSDADGLLDPLDTIPSAVAYNYSPNPTSSTILTWHGLATEAPYDAPDPKYTDTTLNYLTTVEYRIDGGGWNTAIPDDGAFDTTYETFTCSAGPLTDGAHTVDVRARNQVGNYSLLGSDTVLVDTIPPTNPTLVIPGCAAVNGVWQNVCPDPNFAWNGASDGSGSGILGYYTYWGADPVGMGTNWVWAATPNYDPPAVPDPSTYFLRIQTHDIVSNTAPWTTLFTFLYDAQLPTSSVISITALVPLQSYQINWSGSDVGSGITNYDVQYRVGASGTWTDWLPATPATSATFGPGAPVSIVIGETYYFRVRARDQAGNLEVYPSSDGDRWFTAGNLMYCPLILTP